MTLYHLALVWTQVEVYVAVEDTVATSRFIKSHCKNYPHADDTSYAFLKLNATPNFQAMKCHLPGDGYFYNDGQSCHIYSTWYRLAYPQ